MKIKSEYIYNFVCQVSRVGNSCFLIVTIYVQGLMALSDALNEPSNIQNSKETEDSEPMDEDPPASVHPPSVDGKQQQKSRVSSSGPCKLYRAPAVQKPVACPLPEDSNGIDQNSHENVQSVTDKISTAVDNSSEEEADEGNSLCIVVDKLSPWILFCQIKTYKL